MIKKLQNKKVVNPQSKGGSTMGKLSLNTVWTKAFIIFFLFGFWRVGEGQTIFNNPVQINWPPPSTGHALEVDGQIRFNNLLTSTGFTHYLAFDPITGEVTEQEGVAPLPGNATGDISYWDGVQWVPAPSLLFHVDQPNNFIGIGTTMQLFQSGSDYSDPSQPNGWNPAGGATTNPILSVAGGDIECDEGLYLGDNVYIQSDRSLKTNISELNNWRRILNLKAYSYNYIGKENERLFYGFMAQDVYSVLPEFTTTWRGKGAVNYIGFVPFLTQGIKEHEERLNAIEQGREMPNAEIEELKVENQILNDKVENLNNKVETLETRNEGLEKENQEMKSRLTALEEKFNAICNLPCIQNNPTPNGNGGGTGSGFGQTGKLGEPPALEQNEPNPFNVTTVIRYFLPEATVNARIEVRNVENKVVGSFPISQSGHGNITLSAGTLAAGNYFYSLIINNNIIETKKMILLN